MQKLTADALKQLLHYNPETGVFRWISGKRFGQVAGGPMNGYVRICMGKYGEQLAHRLAWLYMTGEWPTKHVDHADCDRANNKWSNLRLAGPDQNAANSRRSKNNISGAKGVIPYRGGFRATIQIRGIQHYLGDYNTIEEAAAAYAGAAKVGFGEFARTA
jgi:hypothetical protein